MIKNKRFVPKNVLKKAYKLPEELNIDNNIDNDNIQKVNKLPEDMFKIIGKVVSFVEVIDILEEEKNEN